MQVQQQPCPVESFEFTWCVCRHLKVLRLIEQPIDLVGMPGPHQSPALRSRHCLDHVISVSFRIGKLNKASIDNIRKAKVWRERLYWNVIDGSEENPEPCRVGGHSRDSIFVFETSREIRDCKDLQGEIFRRPFELDKQL